MGRKPERDRSPEAKWQIVQEGIKRGSVSEICRRHRITPNLYHHWSHEAEQGAKAALESTVPESWIAALKKKVQRPTITDFIVLGWTQRQLLGSL